MKLSSSNIKKSLIFSLKKAFLIFQETELSYISASKARKVKRTHS